MMQKVNPIYFAGLAYVQITSLPPAQFEFLDEHVPEVHRIGLSIDDEKLEDCIYYVAPWKPLRWGTKGIKYKFGETPRSNPTGTRPVR
jgi:hypothetical protein